MARRLARMTDTRSLSITSMQWYAGRLWLASADMSMVVAYDSVHKIALVAGITKRSTTTTKGRHHARPRYRRLHQ